MSILICIIILDIKHLKGVFMNQVTKVTITGLAGVGMCTTAPAWAAVAVVTIVVVGTVAIMKD